MAGINAHVCTKTCRRMFPAASLMTTRDRRQQRCPLRGHVVHTCREPWALQRNPGRTWETAPGTQQALRSQPLRSHQKERGLALCRTVSKTDRKGAGPARQRVCSAPFVHRTPSPTPGPAKGPEGQGSEQGGRGCLWALEDANLSPSSHVLHEMLTTCKYSIFFFN